MVQETRRRETADWLKVKRFGKAVISVQQVKAGGERENLHVLICCEISPTQTIRPVGAGVTSHCQSPDETALKAYICD